MTTDSTYIAGDDGQPIDVTSTSAATLIALDGYDSACEDVIVQNIGASPCWIRAGGPSVAATQLSVMVPAMWRETFRKGAGATHIAAACASGMSTQIVVTPVPAG